MEMANTSARQALRHARCISRDGRVVRLLNVLAIMHPRILIGHVTNKTNPRDIHVGARRDFGE